MTASGMNERDERKSTFGEASKVFLTTSKPEVCFYSGKSVAETLYGALVVKSDFHSSHLFPPILLFGPAEPFFRPGRSFRGPSRAAAVKDGPVFGATASAARSVLDGCEHDGKMRRLGATHFASLVRESASVGCGIAEPPV